MEPPPSSVTVNTIRCRTYARIVRKSTLGRLIYDAVSSKKGTTVRRPEPFSALPPEQVESLVSVLDAVRIGAATTRPAVARMTGLGRNVVTQRVSYLVAAGLLEEGRLGPSTGGRAPRELRFRAEAGVILVAELGATSIEVARSDLAGSVTDIRSEGADVTLGPEPVLLRVAELLDGIVADLPTGTDVWGVGLGLPAPVEFETGTPVAPPIMPGWDGYDVRSFFASRYGAPVWVDNDVNVMALGELRGGLAAGHRDVVFVKIGTGIGAGLISRGALHRGAQGCAGDIGHVSIGDSTMRCRCGQLGCLEAHAGGFALARDGRELARSGASPELAKALAQGRELTADTVIKAAQRGDLAAGELVIRSARLVGVVLASLVNFFNPSLSLVGGGLTSSGEMYLGEVRRSVLSRSLPLATRSLQVMQSPLADSAGLRGAAFMVVDEILSLERLAAVGASETIAG
jgi:glucokinase-like ROK family protein